MNAIDALRKIKCHFGFHAHEVIREIPSPGFFGPGTTTTYRCKNCSDEFSGTTETMNFTVVVDEKLERERE